MARCNRPRGSDGDGRRGVGVGDRPGFSHEGDGRRVELDAITYSVGRSRSAGHLDQRADPYVHGAPGAIRQPRISHRGEADSWEDRNLNERCMTPQAATGLGGTIRIVQAPGWVAILPDGLQPTHLIPLDARPQVSSKIRGWFGRSRGRWDGDKLVIETTNFIGKLDGGPILASRRPFGFYPGSGE